MPLTQLVWMLKLYLQTLHFELNLRQVIFDDDFERKVVMRWFGGEQSTILSVVKTVMVR